MEGRELEPASRVHLLGRPFRWPWQAEVFLVVSVAAVQLVGTMLDARHEVDVRGLDPFGYLLLALGPGLLPTRLRWPVWAFASVFASTLAYTLLNYPGGPIWVPLIVTFGTVLVSRHRVVAYTSLPFGYLGFMFLPGWLGLRSLSSAAAAVGVAAWMLLVLAASELFRNRRAYQLETRRRLLEAARSREEEARRQASEQRLAIARELHDVLAHSISLINVQAGVALELMDRRPEQVRSSLAAIKQASKDALVDVQTMLGTLRGPEESLARRPVPGVANIAQLADRARATGLTVHTTITGEPGPLAASVDLAAYRIVQEALTNAVRHAAAQHVTVRVCFGTREVTVEVTDDGLGLAAAPSLRGGHGIRGMRERAAAIGGELIADTKADGGFRVRARLPLTGLGTEGST